MTMTYFQDSVGLWLRSVAALANMTAEARRARNVPPIVLGSEGESTYRPPRRMSLAKPTTRADTLAAIQSDSLSLRIAKSARALRQHAFMIRACVNDPRPDAHRAMKAAVKRRGMQRFLDFFSSSRSLTRLIAAGSQADLEPAPSTVTMNAVFDAIAELMLGELRDLIVLRTDVASGGYWTVIPTASIRNEEGDVNVRRTR